MRRDRRPGFTLFQLLVVLAVLAILLGLLLPAVAKVREAAARTQSQNNMKQIGIACHNYHSVYNVFPPGVDDKHFSAAAKLLPYIEQDNLYKAIDFKKPADDKANEAARQAIIKTYLSPLDPLPGGPGASNYLFNAGSKYPLKGNDGLFYLDSKVKLPDITDGTSNTLLTGETLKGADRPRTARRQYVGLPAAALAGLKDESGVKDFADGKERPRRPLLGLDRRPLPARDVHRHARAERPAARRELRRRRRPVGAAQRPRLLHQHRHGRRQRANHPQGSQTRRLEEPGQPQRRQRHP
jgi:type II secretory pathway pseudopilin PulG